MSVFALVIACSQSLDCLRWNDMGGWLFQIQTAGLGRDKQKRPPHEGTAFPLPATNGLRLSAKILREDGHAHPVRHLGLETMRHSTTSFQLLNSLTQMGARMETSSMPVS